MRTNSSPCKNVKSDWKIGRLEDWKKYLYGETNGEPETMSERATFSLLNACDQRANSSNSDNEILSDDRPTKE